MNRYDDIQQLLDSYMAGTTTNDDEARLRTFFATHDDIPAEWTVYRAIFTYVGAERLAHAKVPVAPVAMAPAPTPTDPRRQAMHIASRARRLWIAAASVAAVVVVGTLLWHPADHTSYAVIDGRMCTNQHEVKAEALSALQNIELEGDDQAFSALGNLND